MDRRDIPKCCALTLITNFGNTNAAVDSTPYTKKEIKDFLKEDQKKKYDKTIRVIFLNEEQLNKIGKELFEKLDYTIVELGYYPGHGNNIFMLTYNPNKEDEDNKSK